MYNCEKCGFNTNSVSELANHYQYFHREKNKECFCGECGKKFKNEKGLKCHTKKTCEKIIMKKSINHICFKCGLFISNSMEKHNKYCDGNGTKRKKIKKPELKPDWKIGKTYEELFGLEKSIKIKEKISKNTTGFASTPEKEKIRREKLRNVMLEKYKQGYEVKCGRCKKIDYHSEIAGDVKLDGGWELSVAKYLDNLNVKWIRNKQRFSYWNSIKNCESTYCPDFFVEDWNKFIEVKGYETDLDKIKWEQFKGNLEIWNSKKLKELGIKAKWL